MAIDSRGRRRRTAPGGQRAHRGSSRSPAAAATGTARPAGRNWRPGSAGFSTDRQQRREGKQRRHKRNPAATDHDHTTWAPGQRAARQYQLTAAVPAPQAYGRPLHCQTPVCSSFHRSQPRWSGLLWRQGTFKQQATAWTTARATSHRRKAAAPPMVPAHPKELGRGPNSAPAQH